MGRRIAIIGLALLLGLVAADRWIAPRYLRAQDSAKYFTRDPHYLLEPSMLDGLRKRQQRRKALH